MEEIIRKAIHKALLEGKERFVIYPFGEQGKRLKSILNSEYGIQEALIIDNGRHCEEANVSSLAEAPLPLLRNSTLFLTSDNSEIYFELRNQILQYVPKENIVDIFDGDRNTLNMMQKFLAGKTTKIIFNPILNLRKERSVNALGGNTGNLVFVEAMKEQLNYDYEDALTRKWNKEHMGQRNIVSVMPASNFVQSNTVWYENLISVLQDTDIRFTLVGLGAQANFDETPKDVVNKLSDKQKRFFQLVSEHAVQIGVRGEFTAECLKEMGIKNVELIGCPSFYQYGGGVYPLLMKPRADKVLFTADRGRQAIYRLAESSKSQLICQNYEDAERERKIFYTITEWNQYIQASGFSFAFGSRFHGNMMALNNKIPTLWIAHDWRTLELVRYLGLPYIDYYSDKFQKMKHVEELFEYCDYSEVYKRYFKLYNVYCDFIRKNFDENFLL